MQTQTRAWLVVFALLATCAAVVGGLHYYRTYRRVDAAQLMANLPAGPYLLVYIDVSALRQSGILDVLGGPAAVEDLDYRNFVSNTRFDYRKDLDAVAGAFQGDEDFYLVRGRFDWKAIRAYATSVGGSCGNALCTVPSSRPERHISFLPLRADMIALAVSPNPQAAKAALGLPKRGTGQVAPDQPVWVSIPPNVLRNPASFPAGTQLFAQALENADRVVLSIGPEGGRLLAQLDVDCPSAGEAVRLEAEFESATEVIRKLVSEGKQAPDPRNLSAILSAGRFRRERSKVFGKWPIERAFLEAMAGGAR